MVKMLRRYSYFALRRSCHAYQAGSTHYKYWCPVLSFHFHCCQDEGTKFLSFGSAIAVKTLLNKDLYSHSRYLLSTAKANRDSSKNETTKLSQREKLKLAVRDYGAVVIVFHVGISLLSLGGFYLAVANGLDVIYLLQKLGFSDYVTNSKVLLEGSTFVIAYGIHKLFAPVRIAITLSSAPFIVRYLRKIQFLKSPKVK